MSSPERYLEVSDQARSDIRGIIGYTFEVFGEQQAIAYESEIFDALGRLLVFPSVGPAVSDRDPLERVLTVRSHRIWYRIRIDRIEIAAITHAKSLRNPFEQ